MDYIAPGVINDHALYIHGSITIIFFFTELHLNKGFVVFTALLMPQRQIAVKELISKELILKKKAHHFG